MKQVITDNCGCDHNDYKPPIWSRQDYLESFFIQGNPVPQKRARTSQGRVYNPQAKEKINTANIIRHQRAHSATALEGPLYISFKFAFPIPKTKQTKKFNLDGEPMFFRPDTDNCVKFYLDCLQEAEVFFDDAQIVDLHAMKMYSLDPQTIITIGKFNHSSVL